MPILCVKDAPGLDCDGDAPLKDLQVRKENVHNLGPVKAAPHLQRVRTFPQEEFGGRCPTGSKRKYARCLAYVHFLAVAQLAARENMRVVCPATATRKTWLDQLADSYFKGLPEHIFLLEAASQLPHKFFDVQCLLLPFSLDDWDCEGRKWCAMAASLRSLRPATANVVTIAVLQDKNVTASKVTEVMDCLLKSGVEDVLVRRKFFSSDVLIRLASIRRQQAKLQRIRKSYQSRANVGPFWQSVDTFLQGFPPLNHDLPANPGINTKIGLCTLKEKLGVGGFGTVYKAVRRTGETEAIKVIPKQSPEDSIECAIEMWNEIQLTGQLDHANVVSLIGVLHGPSHVLISLKCAGSMSLFTILSRRSKLEEREIRHFFVQQACAISYCHGVGIAHRDLKPENACISDAGILTVIDFGSATIQEEMGDMVGTIPFMSVEAMTCSEDNVYRPKPHDVWALGIVLLELTGGIGWVESKLDLDRNPHPCPSTERVFRLYFSNTSQVFDDIAGSCMFELKPTFLHMLEGSLNTDPRKRCTAKELHISDWLHPASAASSFRSGTE